MAKAKKSPIQSIEVLKPSVEKPKYYMTRYALAAVLYALSLVALVLAAALGRMHEYVKPDAPTSPEDEAVAKRDAALDSEEESRARYGGRLKASEGLRLASELGRTVRI